MAREGTLKDAIEAVSTMDIVEHFKVPYEKRRGRTLILCPGHDDHSFGSCFIDNSDNGYYCYACKEWVNKWKMVLKLNGSNERAACDFFFSTAGIIPTKNKSVDPLTPVLKLIRELEDYIDNSTIYSDKYSCEKKESSYSRSLNGKYLFSEVAMRNPMLELYKSNKPLFKKLVIRQLQRKLKNIEEFGHDGCYITGIGLIPNNYVSRIKEKKSLKIKSLIRDVQKL